jgi:membrane associated rhomboid family serine protease
MTPWVFRLLLANVVIFFLLPVGSPLWMRMMLIPSAVTVQPWGIVTYMFLHGGGAHLFLNMLGLFFFGPRLEALLGSRDFLRLYFVSGLGGALLSFLPMTYGASVVGASGAIYGILLAFAIFFPRERIYIWGILPVEARFLAIFLAVTSLVSGITGSGAGTAHFAHLGGFVGAWAFLRWRRRKRGGRRVEVVPGLRVPVMPAPPDLSARWQQIPLEELHVINREEVEKLLQKVREGGARALSPDERAFLDRMVRR